MKIAEFRLERIQSLFENTVACNLSDSGVHPYTLAELLTPAERETLHGIELGYGWTNGAPELRADIAALYAGRSAEEVIVTNGSAEANFLAVMTLVEPGDEVIVVVPNYLQIHGWAAAVGARVVEVALREDRGWLPDVGELAAAITPRTRMITLCTPNNPTGRVIPAAMLAQIVELARPQGIWLHADEVYKGAEYGTDEAPSLADLYDRALVTNGLSKAMALPGLRLGWLVGPAPVIAAAWLRKDYTSITTAALSEAIARIVLQPARRAAILARSRDLLGANVATVAHWVARNPDLVSLVPPHAGGMAFVRYRLPMNSMSLAHALRAEESVLVAPGDVYGIDGHIRIGVGAPTERLAMGLARIESFLRRMAERSPA